MNDHAKIVRVLRLIGLPTSAKNGNSKKDYSITLKEKAF